MTAKIISGLALALALAGASAGFAQPAEGPPGGRMEQGWERPDPAVMAQKRADSLRDLLQLRPNQEPALGALMEAMRPPEGMRERMMGENQAMMKLSTPERLDRMRDHMARRQAAFDTRAAAIKRFYSQLTPAQQKAFDALPPMGMRHHGMGGMGGHGGPGMGPHAPG